VGKDIIGGGERELIMCLAIPALIKSIEDKEAEVEIGGITRRISLWLTPEAKVGDYVLVHTGYAINVVDQEQAEETLSLLREIAEEAG
jgi:hydrogenase expression/formation protein HypC